MKFLTLPALLAAALLSAAVALPLLPSARMGQDRFALELVYTTPAAASVQLYLDDGGGYRDSLQAQAALPAAEAPALVGLPIPAGTYRSVRLDPPEGGREMTLRSARLRTRAGRTLAEIPLAELRAGQQLAALAPGPGGLVVRSLPGSDDPQLLHDFPAPVVVGLSWRDYAAELLPFQLPVLAALVALLFLLDRLAGIRGRVAVRFGALAPGTRVALAAAGAVLASAYPVVFLGKSHVSPNLGTTLLYGEFPTLPGDRSTETTDVKLSDIGAVMWQHVPFSMMQRRALLEGELPLWNRYSAMGVPLLGQGQSMFGDPLHLLVVAADGEAWAWDAKYLLAKWLLAFGLGLSVLALTRPGPATAAVLVAVAAPFLGFFLYRLNHPAYFSLCYAPWPLYCLVRIALLDPARDGAGAVHRGTRRWSLALLGANLALMCSGTVKEAYMLLVSVNLAGAGVVLAGHGDTRSRLGRLGTLAWHGILFALLTAPVWGTFLGALGNAYTGYNEASAYQLQPALLLGLFDEAFYRPLLTKDQVFGPSLNFLLLLGILYYLATLRDQFTRPAAIALGAACLPPLALAFGLVPPAWIVTVPFLRNVAHLDNTFSCVLIVLGTVLAGLGFASAGRRLGTREGRGDLAIAALLLFALVFAWIAFGRRPTASSSARRSPSTRPARRSRSTRSFGTTSRACSRRRCSSRSPRAAPLSTAGPPRGSCSPSPACSRSSGATACTRPRWASMTSPRSRRRGRTSTPAPRRSSTCGPPTPASPAACSASSRTCSPAGRVFTAWRPCTGRTRWSTPRCATCWAPAGWSANGTGGCTRRRRTRGRCARSSTR